MFHTLNLWIEVQITWSSFRLSRYYPLAQVTRRKYGQLLLWLQVGPREERCFVWWPLQAHQALIKLGRSKGIPLLTAVWQITPNKVSKQQSFYYIPEFHGSGIWAWLDRMALLLFMALTEVTSWYWLTDRLVWRSMLPSFCVPGTWLKGWLCMGLLQETPACGFSSKVKGSQAGSWWRRAPKVSVLREHVEPPFYSACALNQAHSQPYTKVYWSQQSQSPPRLQRKELPLSRWEN